MNQPKDKSQQKRARPSFTNATKRPPRGARPAGPCEHDGPAPTGWLLQSPPGLAASLKREMTYVGAIERRQNLFISRQRNHDLLFVNKLKSDEGLSRLRVAEMILFCPVFGRYKISQRQLGSMAEALKAAGPRRLVVAVTGKHFQRHDLLRYLEREMSERGYEFNNEIEDEVWMFCIDESYYFGLPQRKARDTEGRDQRVEERQGALPPPVAASLSFALSPKADDVVLDPCCGSGTCLAEFAAYAPGARLIGMDIDPAAVAIARTNLSHVENVTIENRDSRTSGIEPGTVTAVVANLPFGVQFGKKEDNPKLYREIIQECLRLRHPTNFRALFFTSDTTALQKAVSGIEGVELEEALRVKVRGESAVGFMLKF